MDLSMSLKEWARIHDYAFGVIMQITLYLNGGVESNFASPRAAVIHAEIRVRNDADMSPASLFRFKGVEVVDKDERHYLSSKWEYLEQSRARRTEEVRRSGSDQTFVGSLPAVFILHVEDIGTITAHHAFPIYRPQSHDLDESTRLAFLDLMHLCGAGITAGFSYHRPSRPMHAPEVYQWVLSAKKKWRPVQIKDWNWDINMGNTMAQHPDHYKSGLQPLMLWSTFRNL